MSTADFHRCFPFFGSPLIEGCPWAAEGGVPGQLGMKGRYVRMNGPRYAAGRWQVRVGTGAGGQNIGNRKRSMYLQTRDDTSVSALIPIGSWVSSRQNYLNFCWPWPWEISFNFSFSYIFIQAKFMKFNALSLKYQSWDKQKIILKNSCEKCLDSCSFLKAQVWKNEILVLVWKVEKGFSLNTAPYITHLLLGQPTCYCFAKGSR